MVVEIPVTEARAKFSDLVNRVGYGGERVVLTRHGKPLVALLPAGDLDVSSDQLTVLDLTSQRTDARSGYGLAAHDQAPPRA